MTREEVKAAVGDPDKTTEQKWGYSGDSLFVAFSEDNHVVTIEAGLGSPWKGSPPNRFRGRSKAGIGVGSTREAVLVALGTPRRTSQHEGLEAMYYRELGLVLGLWKDEVVSISVTRPAP
jgi:hypothetical protein